MSKHEHNWHRALELATERDEHERRGGWSALALAMAEGRVERRWERGQ